MTARTRQNLRKLWHWVLLAPFVLLSFLSPAVMPSVAPDGTLTLILCSDGDVSEMVIDLATGKPVESSPADGTDRCDWACGQWAVADPGLADPPLPVRRSFRASHCTAATTIAALHKTGLPPATGPPILL